MAEANQDGPYWIDTGGLARSMKDSPLRMAIVRCPPGGDRTQGYVKSLQAAGIEVLVSLLEPEETRILGLEQEGAICRRTGMIFRWMPVQDHFVPESAEEFALMVEEIRRELHEGKPVAAHCYAGIGRSCMLMACVLCAEGLTPEQAFSRLSKARGVNVPDTWMQIRWVEHFAASLRVP